MSCGGSELNALDLACSLFLGSVVVCIHRILLAMYLAYT